MRFLPHVLAAALASVAVAQDSKSPGQLSTPPTAITLPSTPPASKEIPVPDGPVLKKQEVEGIIIEDLKLGEGYEVKPGGAAVAYYHGTLKDGGKVFDSTFKSGEPISFRLSAMIPGWQKGVPGMKVGGVRRLTVPAPMAFGSQGSGNDIPPNADLVFVVQLVDALQIEDIKVGDGEVAGSYCIAVTAHRFSDMDGKEIEKVEAGKPHIWLPGEFQPIQFGVEGMKVGGKRKLIVPKEMNVSPPQALSKREQKVPVTIEFDLVAVRNISQPRR